MSTKLNLGFRSRSRIRHIRQTEVTECGLASLVMIANYHGLDIDLGTLRRQFAPSLRGAALPLRINWAILPSDGESAPVKIEARVLEGRHVRLEPVHEGLRDEMRAALDCDPESWNIQSVSGRGEQFDGYWNLMVGTPGRIAFAVRDKASGRLAGTSSLLDIDPQHRTLEIGHSWLRPESRGGKVNPEAKLLMLSHAFDAGALRVQFSVDARNERSQAAVAKLGAMREGVIRRHRVTWTGHKRDTVIFSIIDREWPSVRAGLLARLGRAAG